MIHKSPLRLTTTQSKALNFIRSAVELTGTAPTLRELCTHMGYSAVGSAQDLVAALRKKGFLLTPATQSARSLVLSPKALGLYGSKPAVVADHVLEIACFEKNLPKNISDLARMNRVSVLRMSLNMFAPPYPSTNRLFAVQVEDDRMLGAGILTGDWVIIEMLEDIATEGIIYAWTQTRSGVCEWALGRVMQDREGLYLRSENSAFPAISLSECWNIAGRVVAVQRFLL